KRTIRKFTYRGVDLDRRRRWRLNRGLQRKRDWLLKKDALHLEKPEVEKTHLGKPIFLPQMLDSMIGVYNGKPFNLVEIKPEMIGHYLGEFCITYKPVKHSGPGMGPHTPPDSSPSSSLLANRDF
ncbi:hypothetical protein K5549_021447, partial [Capra hircus]